MNRNNLKGFTLIEMIMIISILGVVMLMATLSFKGYNEKKEIAVITDNIKSAEIVMTSKVVNNDNTMKNWLYVGNEKHIKQLMNEGNLYNKKGLIDNPNNVVIGDYKIIDENELNKELKLNLPGDFYINNTGGTIYYYNNNIEGSTCVPDDPPLTEDEIDELVNSGYIPITSAYELNQIRPINVDPQNNPIYEELTWGKDTKWEQIKIGTLNSNYIQINNINMQMYGEEYDSNQGWQPIPNFTGIYNGANYSIDYLYINRPTEDGIGLFGQTYNAKITNVKLRDIKVKGKDIVGGLVGWVNNDMSTTIENSNATGSIIGVDCVGGLVGYVNNNTGHMDIQNSYANGMIHGYGNYAGGLVGLSSSNLLATMNILNSYSTSVVEGLNYTGGLIGTLNSNNSKITIDNSHATGTTNGNDNVGGLVGQVHSANEGQIQIIQSYTTGSITGDNNVGGLVGYGSSINLDSITHITDSYAMGEVKGLDSAGGLLGRMDAQYAGFVDITQSHATGNVVGRDNIGGLVGSVSSSQSSNAYITTSYATGDVIGIGYRIGGLVGQAVSINSESKTLVNNSYTTGNVIGERSHTGGLVGEVLAHESGITALDTLYSIGLVSGVDGYIGGAIGGLHTEFDGVVNILNIYWDTESSEQTIGVGLNLYPEYVIGKTTKEMKRPSTYKGWTIDVWNFKTNHYPTLK